MENPNKPYFEMLDTMQETGGVNMFGAPQELRELFPGLSRRESTAIVVEWMQNQVVKDEPVSYTHLRAHET